MLLSDLLTPQEVEALAERWWIAERLSRGEAQRSVAEALQVSITTVSRGARSLKYGAGGFDLALKTLANLQTAGVDGPAERK
jgi:Trp operon repressor